jgi:hypothetical protein
MVDSLLVGGIRVTLDSARAVTGPRCVWFHKGDSTYGHYI